MGKIKDLVDILKPALESVKTDTSDPHHGIQARYLNELKAEIANFGSDDFSKGEEEQNVAVKAFYEKHFINSKKNTSSLKHFCQTSPQLKQAVEALVEKGIFTTETDHRKNNFLTNHVIVGGMFGRTAEGTHSQSTESPTKRQRVVK